MRNADVPPRYRALVARLGRAVPVEEARSQRWADLVRAAEAGVVTLITRERWEWAALVPLAEVAEPVAGLPMWSLSQARTKLGHLVRAATAGDGTAQVLIRGHRRLPVAALISAEVLADRPAPADRLDAERLLRDGARLEIAYRPGRDGTMSEAGGVLDEPIPALFTVIAYGPDGAELATGQAEKSYGEALLRLWAPTPAEVVDDPPF